MPFQKGKSGNPGGRAKKTKEQADFEDNCRGFLFKKGFKILSEMIGSKTKGQDRRWAMEQMLNRGFGKPVDYHDITARDEGAEDSSEVLERMEQLLGRRKKGSDGPGEPTK